MNPLTRLAVVIGRQKWMPRLLPVIVAVDGRLHRATRGRVTLPGLAGLPVLMLTVVGSKSGVPRTTPLVYTPYGGRFLIAGSNFGGTDKPAWAHNLEARGDAMVVLGGRTIPVVSRIAEGDERAAMWQAMVRVWPNYAVYAERTDRQIPVFVLEPNR